jgi:hypothetical protein
VNKYIPIFQEYARNARFDFEELHESSGVLMVTLTDDRGGQIVLNFDSYFAYRKLEEGDALLTLESMQNSGGATKCFYRVDASDFLRWFNAERCGELVGGPLIHYSIAALNDIIDVLALEPPKISQKMVRILRTSIE